jgi:O-antigen/teichoic acid export membrane protein
VVTGAAAVAAAVGVGVAEAVVALVLVLVPVLVAGAALGVLGVLGVLGALLGDGVGAGVALPPPPPPPEPKGSEYWSSPGDCASAGAAKARAAATAAGAASRRRRWSIGRKGRGSATVRHVATDSRERAPAPPGPRARRTAIAGLLREPETIRAASMAVATMAANLIAVGFTIVFTRLLGTDGYGSLAALLNLSVILYVPGSALQVAAARQGALGRLGDAHRQAAVLAGWTRTLLVALVAIAAVSVLLRAPLAALLNVDEEWAAAFVPVTGGLWLLVSLQRGVLQGARAYGAVGSSIVLEATARLAAGAALAGAGLDVTGAYLGTPAALGLTAAVLGLVAGRRLGPPVAGPQPAAPEQRLAELARRAAVPIAALTLVAVLQNVDVILARHVLSDHDAGVYAAATVAAKALVWIAIGLGVWLLPEAVSRVARGDDPRPVLGRALALIGAVAVPALAAYAIVPAFVLRTAFGPDYVDGQGILLALGAAYALLAVSYLCVQYRLGLHEKRFLAVLAVAAIAEPVALTAATGLGGFAAIVLAVQALAALTLLVPALARR